jgi:hypothetical protein
MTEISCSEYVSYGTCLYSPQLDANKLQLQLQYIALICVAVCLSTKTCLFSIISSLPH